MPADSKDQWIRRNIAFLRKRSIHFPWGSKHTNVPCSAGSPPKMDPRNSLYIFLPICTHCSPSEVGSLISLPLNLGLPCDWDQENVLEVILQDFQPLALWGLVVSTLRIQKVLPLKTFPLGNQLPCAEEAQAATWKDTGGKPSIPTKGAPSQSSAPTPSLTSETINLPGMLVPQKIK